MKKYFLILVMISIALMAVGINSKSDGAMSFFTVSPNPMEDYTVISMIFDHYVDVNVYIQELDGTVIRTLFSGRANKEMLLEWNRLSNDGEYVPDGTYVVAVNYQSRYTSTKKTLILK